MVNAIAPVACSAKTSVYNKLFLKSNIKAITSDPDWNDGWYGNKPPIKGVHVMAHIYAGWGISEEFYRKEMFQLFGHSTLDDFLEIVDFRYKADFKIGGVVYYTMSLDDVTSISSGEDPKNYYELELEIIPMPHTNANVEELFRIITDLEADYTLIISTTSKGGLEVPESF